MFYLVQIFKTSSLGDSIASNPERTATDKVEVGGGAEESDYIEVCNKGQVV